MADETMGEVRDVPSEAVPDGGTAAHRPSDLRLVWEQVRYQNKLFWRNPVSAFFTLAFPLLIYVVFSVTFGNPAIESLGVTVGQYYAPALAVYAAANATYLNIGITTAYQRDLGILKRIRGTPLPAWVHLAGRMLSSAYIAFVGVLVMLVFGVAFYGLRIYPDRIPAAILTLVVGASAFGALGLLVAAVSPSGQAATAVANATLLPLAFFSGIFIIADDAPRFVQLVGDVFPLKHFFQAFFAAFDPLRTDLAFEWRRLGYVALWGVVGMALAVRWFRWEPPAGGTRRRRRRR